MVEVKLGKYNLFLEPDDDIEIFRDSITDNAFINGELLKKGEKKQFGNMCVLEGVNNVKEGEDKVRSTFLLHTQAEENMKIEILWNYSPVDDQPSEYDYEGYSEFYFEDTGKGLFDEGPNSDPQNNSHWEEILSDMQS